ncbi:hypothetical protein RB5433 [Rhodopirellula baltica SH 1]|uniref:Uncharacterized protein n=1 Tax=Rhodopirellula baltica (strain DSM 10527 / NCIMB 13988 / SH1) TaxID=243090 RepID=Q7URV3_RHOBA|nr:hypothetical protein RB5433 [Rhodopirellula baltica SH 1]
MSRRKRPRMSGTKQARLIRRVVRSAHKKTTRRESRGFVFGSSKWLSERRPIRLSCVRR